MLYTFDISRTLNLALVVEEDLTNAKYVPLAEAPAEHRSIAHPYLRQLHAIANTDLVGLVARQRTRFNPADWEAMLK